ncbi:hypothetical protein AB0L63_19505 [Nocardia sp. NPDC051990]|uniref:hypothetical protein n=1 Tax=Nocardia sp. NPDC051990 TaxID=3155285 RepID=UPI00343DEA73
MTKISEKVHELKDHAESTEKKIAAAQKETEKKMDAAIDSAKAEAKVRQDTFKANVAARKAAAASEWETLQAEHNKRVEKIKNTIAAKKDTHNLNVANRRADDAEGYASASIDYALMAIDDAEIATLEAIDARAYAESLT